MTTFCIEGLQSPNEVLVAWQAVEQYRQSGSKPETSSAQQVDQATAAVAQRVLKGLNLGPLGPRYQKILETWFNAAPNQAVTVEDLQAAVGASNVEIRANLSKLSARMKRIATVEEAASLRTPFLLLAEIQYDERNSSRHRLTTAGREAVRQYLNRR